MSTLHSQVVILGSGLDAAVAAAVLSNALEKAAVKITVIESSTISEVDRCVSMSPSIHAFNKILGINESELVNSTNAVFSLAHCYSRQNTKPYFFPYGEHGFTLRGMNFFSYAAYVRAKGDNTDFDQYSLGALAASLGRFRHPAEETKSLYSTLAYGLDFSASLFSEYLKKYAKRKSVEFVSATVDKYIISEDNGHINALQVMIHDPQGSARQQVKIACDLIVDCSGKDGVIIDDVLDVEWIDSTRYLPVNRRVDFIKLDSTIGSSNQIHFFSSGLGRQASHQKNSYFSYIYNSRFIADEQALSELLSHHKITQNSHESDHFFVNLRLGRRASFWYKNCVAIGASAGDLSSIYIDQVHLAQSAALRLATLFPSTSSFENLSKEYNRLSHLEYDHIEDFHSLHFRVPGMPQTDFWSAQSAAPVSDRLQHRMNLFKSVGRIPFFEGETLSESAWLSFMVGLLGWPDDYNCLIELSDLAWVKEHLHKMHKMMQQAAHAMPNQDVYLKQYLARNFLASH